MFDLQSRGYGFDSQLGQYQVLTTMGGCLLTGEPFSFITNS